MGTVRTVVFLREGNETARQCGLFVWRRVFAWPTAPRLDLCGGDFRQPAPHDLRDVELSPTQPLNGIVLDHRGDGDAQVGLPQILGNFLASYAPALIDAEFLLVLGLIFRPPTAGLAGISLALSAALGSLGAVADSASSVDGPSGAA